jgi:hypothetical protein
VGFRLMTIRDVVPMKSKPALFSLFCASLSFTGVLTEENPLIVACEDGKYTLEMRALQATRGLPTVAQMGGSGLRATKATPGSSTEIVRRFSIPSPGGRRLEAKAR